MEEEGEKKKIECKQHMLMRLVLHTHLAHLGVSILQSAHTSFPGIACSSFIIMAPDRGLAIGEDSSLEETRQTHTCTTNLFVGDC